MDTHKFDVRELSKQVRSFYEQRKPFRIYHGDSHSFRAMHDPKAVIHTSHLHHVLDVNKTSRFAIVEPNISMDKLLKEMLKYGLMPPVVPSFPGLTVGGTFAGTAGSSASFRYGFFDQAVLWVEVVLPDGTITRASRTRNAELLDGTVGSLGTLGIVTLLQIKLVEAAKWVELRYMPVESDVDALETLERLAKDPGNSFLEAILYGPQSPHYGVIVVGKLSTASHHPQVILDNPVSEWFYDHALRACGTTQCVQLDDYLFRHDRGALNLGKYCFGRLPLNSWTRWLADPALRSSPITRTAQALHWADHLFMQDLVTPPESTSTMLDFMEKNLGIYPLLLTPVLRSPNDHASTFTPHLTLSTNLTRQSCALTSSPSLQRTSTFPSADLRPQRYTITVPLNSRTANWSSVFTSWAVSNGFILGIITQKKSFGRFMIGGGMRS
ncbi:hypothetical protein GRF29_103g1664323 [Pseudopithomyces chartarum]|uniref:Delta(24)-sterol reductase n=1 Tax=Pseudopithomyces chartarum TaxID=1892770 RepID=A0AAN6RGS1_9PLEO|nr:hypothetical protein GRF29_103g1664323 [Pseudopithomyces chartarum]